MPAALAYLIKYLRNFLVLVEFIPKSNKSILDNVYDP
jgi:hypothetical protein